MSGRVWMVVCAGLVLGCPAMADQVADFQAAAASGAKGCDSIPFSSDRDRCRSNRDEVGDYCKTDQSGCRDLNTYARQQDLEGIESKLKDLDRARQEARGKRDATSDESEKKRFEDEISQIERSMDEQKRLRDETAKTIDDYKYQARGRMEKAKRCREARIDAVELFDDVARKVKDAASSADIAPFVPTLLDKYQDNERGHTIAIKEAQERLLICEKSSRGESF